MCTECKSQRIDISTHTLRKEGDRRLSTSATNFFISTHTLRKEGDYQYHIIQIREHQFQPTPSARRVTKAPEGREKQRRYLQPTPSRKEGDYMRFYPIIKFLTFQPTPSARRVVRNVNSCDTWFI